MRLPLIFALAISCNSANTNLTSGNDLGGGGGNDNPTTTMDLARASSSNPDLSTNRDLATVQANDYGSDGPEPVNHFTLTATNGSTSIPLTVYAPQAAGARAVVILSSGLQQPAAAYLPYAQRLASWGIITLLRDDPGILSSSTSVAGDVSYLGNSWLAAQNADARSPLSGRVDTTRIGLAGHSRGGQATLLAAEGDLRGKVKAWFGIDPVDSAPMGQSGPQARTQIGTIGIPTAFLGETTDGSGAQACAPSADNYQMLYGDAPAPSARIDALGADHTQFEDPNNCSFCVLCTAGTATASTVLAYSVRYLTAFFARELDGDAQVGAAFAGAGASVDEAASLVTITSK